MYLGSWKIDDLLTFSVVTTRVDTGAATDADSAPSYRVYEDETSTPLLTGTMALLDGSNTAGFYSEQITLSAANGFEKGKSYNIYIQATVNSVVGATSRNFQMEAEVDANVISDPLTGINGKLDTIDDFLDTEVAAILADTNELQTDWVNGGRLDLLIDAIKAKTDNLPADPADASDIAGAFTSLNTKIDTIDDFLDTEIQSLITMLTGIVPANGTIGATGNDTTHLHLSGLAYADDGPNSMLLLVKDVSAGIFVSRWIEDFANTGDLATVATLPFTPEASVDLYWLLPVRADVTGGSGLDAAGVRAAVGLASANLDTQLAAIDDAVDTETAAILADTNELQTDWVNGGRLDLLIDAIKAKTDNLPADPADASDIAALIAAVSAKIDTIDDFLDTEISAIKAKTDNLPSDPADDSDIDAQLAAIAAYVDTEITAIQSDITAIKAKTDNLPADPADDSDIDTQLAALSTKLDTIDDFLDTEISAIKAKTDNLPSDPADDSDIDAQLAAILALIDTEVAAILAAVDTEVAAIKTVTDQLVAAHAEPTGAPGATATPLNKLGYIYAALRNAITITGSTKTFKNDAGATLWSKALSDDGTTYTEAEGS
jgi:hypothetical protein